MTPRPKRNRRIGRPPFASAFTPEGAGEKGGSPVILSYDEYEAIRLADYEGMSQVDAAREMDVSRPTFTRIYERARYKVACALTESVVLMIEGGHVKFLENWYACDQCGSSFGVKTDVEATACKVCGSSAIRLLNKASEDKHQRPMRGRGGKGKEGFCVCPGCEKNYPHEAGIPCRIKVCPDCNISLVRAGSGHHLSILNKKNKNN